MHMIEQAHWSKGRASRNRSTASWRLRLATALAALSTTLPPVAAQASMFKGDTLDKVADVIAIGVLIIVPVVGISVFWLVHILPEKIAEKRHHPQADAIKTLCLLSLVFGGLLWPIAWLWAYSKPVFYKMAYGTDKADPHVAKGHAAEVADVPAAADGKGAV